MWLLESLTSPGVKFHLLVGEDYQVGRKDCRIVIAKDQSVSRKHGVLKVSHPDSNLSKPSNPPQVTLQDSSKYGTLVNGSKIQLGSSVTLKDGDLVSFGAMKTNKWRLSYQPLVVAFSAIPSSEKKSLKTLVLKLGGHVVSEWNKDCTHLVMSQLSVTIKVTAALLSCKPIVTPEYLQSMKDAAQCDRDMPDVTNFRPAVIEETIDVTEVNFDPNPVRSTLFRDKAFIFVVEKQFRQLGHTVQLGGGQAILMREDDVASFSSLTKPETIVMYADPDDSMQAPTQETQDWIREVMMHLKKHGLRPIPVSELGLAVLYASTQLHCNPSIGQAGLNLMNAPPSLPAAPPQILVSDTEASCPKNAASSSSRGQRSSANQSKVTGSSSSEDERKVAQGSKKRSRQDSAPQTISKIPKLEPPSPAPTGTRQPSKSETTKTPPRSSESMQSGPNIKTSPEFSYVGQTSKPTHAIKQEIATPPAERNNNKQGKIRGQRAEATLDDEENMDVGTEQDEAASLKEEIEVVQEEKVQRGNSRKNRKATLDSLWDLEGTSRQQKKKGKEGAKAEEEVRGDEGSKDEAKADEDEEDSQNSMWKRKRKRNMLDQIQEDEARESQLSQIDDDPVDTKSVPSAPTETPAGFFTTTKSIKKEEPKAEPDDPTGPTKTDPPPYAVVSIEDSSLVIRRPKPRPAKGASVAGRTNVKNFKKFKKAGYAGQNMMPRIIGGRDLEEHNNKPNNDIDDMMLGLEQAERRRNREEEEADKLFADEPRGRKGRRR